MARNYGLGLDKLVDEDPTQWRQQGTAPGWASGYSFGKGVVEDYQRGTAERDAAEASKAAQMEQRQQGAETSPEANSPYYTQDADGKYFLNKKGMQGYNEDGSGPTPEQLQGMEGTAATYGKDKYGLGANTTTFRDTPYTAAEKRQAGLQAMADSYGRSKAPGSAARAEYYNDRIAAAKDLDTQRQLTKAQIDSIPLQRKHLELQVNASQRAAEDAIADAASRPEIAKRVSALQALSPESPEYATAARDLNQFVTDKLGPDKASTLINSVTTARTAQITLKTLADTEAANKIAKKVQNVKTINELNTKVYSEFHNNQNFAQKKLADGSTVFYHEGDEKNVILKVPKNDINPFSTFKDYLSAGVSNDPSKTIAFQDKLRTAYIKDAEVTAYNDLRTAIYAGKGPTSPAAKMKDSAEGLATAYMGVDPTMKKADALLKAYQVLTKDPASKPGSDMPLDKLQPMIETEHAAMLDDLKKNDPKGYAAFTKMSRSERMAEARDSVLKLHGLGSVDVKGGNAAGGNTATPNRAIPPAPNAATGAPSGTGNAGAPLRWTGAVEYNPIKTDVVSDLIDAGVGTVQQMGINLSERKRAIDAGYTQDLQQKLLRREELSPIELRTAVSLGLVRGGGNGVRGQGM